MVWKFSSFAAIDSKGHFRKKLTGFSNLAAFLVAMPTFLKKLSWVPNTEFNAESVGTSFKSQKWKSKKLVCPFLVAFSFMLRPIWLNKGFSFLWNHFGQWEISSKSVRSRKISWFRQKKNSLINLVQSVLSFCTRTKFRLKNSVTAVHLLEIYCKLKNIHLKEHQIKEHQPPLLKNRFFDSFIPV